MPPHVSSPPKNKRSFHRWINFAASCSPAMHNQFIYHYPKTIQPSTVTTRKRRRPPYSYTAIITQAILTSSHRQLTLREIYEWINVHYPFICKGPDVGWKNIIRHNLSLNQCFHRVPRGDLPVEVSSKLRGKGSYWTVDIGLMDENTRKRVNEVLMSTPVTPAGTGGDASTLTSNTTSISQLPFRNKTVANTFIDINPHTYGYTRDGQHCRLFSHDLQQAHRSPSISPYLGSNPTTGKKGAGSPSLVIPSTFSCFKANTVDQPTSDPR